ncbi:MAG: mandelate racemase/muconate lactonizing enzyme family protein, partial [Pseudomonadota bacterium]
LHHVFGAYRDSVKTYASGGLWLSDSIDTMKGEAEDFVAQGFQSVKIRVGSENPEDDVKRVSAIRETIGDEIELLADANQALYPKQAIKLCKLLEPFNLGWLEEPVPAYDLDGHAQVTARTDTPIASGETEYTRYGMQAMLEKKACDILMPDLQRIGGLTEMRRVAAFAQANNTPISTHIFTEQSLCIAGSTPNCISVEHMPWFQPLFREDMVLRDGELQIPSRNGTGFSFKHH